MGKTAKARTLADNEAKCVVKQLRVSPRKLNLVAGMIRGMKVNDAMTQLHFSKKRIANDVRKALQSAVANAENNHNLDVDALYVKEAYVGQNLVMKRMHTRGRGRSARVLRPFANLTLIVHERGEEEPKAPKKKADTKKAAADKPKAKAAPKAKEAKTEDKPATESTAKKESK